jgi:four helix bundle protein
MTGVRRFEDLDVYKLAIELEDLVYAMTASGRVRDDPGFIDQIRRAVSGPPAHYAEGFGRFKPKDQAKFVRYAKGSLEETRNHLFKGKRHKYFSEEDFNKAHVLVKRCLGATVRFLEYLDSCGGKLPWEVVPPRPPATRERP